MPLGGAVWSTSGDPFRSRSRGAGQHDALVPKTIKATQSPGRREQGADANGAVSFRVGFGRVRTDTTQQAQKCSFPHKAGACSSAVLHGSPRLALSSHAVGRQHLTHARLARLDFACIRCKPSLAYSKPTSPTSPAHASDRARTVRGVASPHLPPSLSLSFSSFESLPPISRSPDPAPNFASWAPGMPRGAALRSTRRSSRPLRLEPERRESRERGGRKGGREQGGTGKCGREPRGEKDGTQGGALRFQSRTSRPIHASRHTTDTQLGRRALRRIHHAHRFEQPASRRRALGFVAAVEARARAPTDARAPTSQRRGSVSPLSTALSLRSLRAFVA